MKFVPQPLLWAVAELIGFGALAGYAVYELIGNLRTGVVKSYIGAPFNRENSPVAFRLAVVSKVFVAGVFLFLAVRSGLMIFGI